MERMPSRPPSTHRVYMFFMLRSGYWYCTFLEPDLKTALPRTLRFATPDKLLEIHERWGEGRLLEDRSALEYGIGIGRGSIWLLLSSEQYARLKATTLDRQASTNTRGTER